LIIVTLVYHYAHETETISPSVRRSRRGRSLMNEYASLLYRISSTCLVVDRGDHRPDCCRMLSVSRLMMYCAASLPFDCCYQDSLLLLRQVITIIRLSRCIAAPTPHVKHCVSWNLRFEWAALGHLSEIMSHAFITAVYIQINTISS